MSPRPRHSLIAAAEIVVGGLMEGPGALFTHFFTRRPDWTLRTDETLNENGDRWIHD